MGTTPPSVPEPLRCRHYNDPALWLVTSVEDDLTERLCSDHFGMWLERMAELGGEARRAQN